MSIINAIGNELFLISQKGTANREQVKGDPKLEQWQHTLMTQGGFLESSPGDAVSGLRKRQQDITEKITTYFDLHRLAIDGQLSDLPRKFKYAADAVHFMKVVQTYVSDVMGVIGALQYNINALWYISAQMQAMVRRDTAALSTLLQDVCNWGLPDLPSLPNIFGDTIWRFNGWDFFPLSSINLYPNFNFNFTFGQCTFLQKNPDFFEVYPTLVKVAGAKYALGTPLYNPPLGGTATSGDTSDTYTQQMKDTLDTPIYGKDFNPNSSMWGSVPDPSTIISNYQMPPSIYKDNIVSIVPSTRTLVGSDGAEEKQTLASISLDTIVASGYDANTTACWLFYMDSCRTDRAGSWLEGFQNTYDSYITPSLKYLASSSVPWNNVLGGTGVQSSPTDIPIIALMREDRNLLWRLSFLEASLLGYVRTKQFDDAADSQFLASFTGSDLDYRSTSITETLASTVLGEGTASYPVETSYPSSIGATVNAVVTQAAINISLAPTWTTNRPQFFYVYDEYANAIPVDRFTQFWRQFADNLTQFLKNDGYLVERVCSYPESLSGAIDPLSATVNAYTQVAGDVNTRNRNWTPGERMLPIPVAPLVVFQSDDAPTASTSGWSSGAFDSAAFMQRPDVQSLPIPVQLAMLRTNQSYANIMANSNAMQAEISSLVSQAQQSIQQFANTGFEVETTNTQTIPPSGVALSFDTTVFDNTNFVQSSTTFKVSTANTYVVTGVVRWASGPICQRTINVVLNGSTVVYTQSTDATTSGPVDMPFSFMQNFAANDTFQVIVGSTNNTDIDTAIGSQLFCVLPLGNQSETFSPDVSEAQDQGSLSGVSSLQAETDLASGVAVFVNSTGKAQAIDPTTTVAGATPFISGVTLGAVSAGAVTSVATTFGGVYTIPGAAFTIGGLIYASADGSITQNYASLASTVRWICVVGRAMSTTDMLFQPHLPSNRILNF